MLVTYNVSTEKYKEFGSQAAGAAERQHAGNSEQPPPSQRTQTHQIMPEDKRQLPDRREGDSKAPTGTLGAQTLFLTAETNEGPLTPDPDIQRLSSIFVGFFPSFACPLMSVK